MLNDAAARLEMLILVDSSKLSTIEQFSKSNDANAGRGACRLHEKEQDAVLIAHSSLTDKPLAGTLHVAVLSSKLKSLAIALLATPSPAGTITILHRLLPG